MSQETKPRIARVCATDTDAPVMQMADRASPSSRRARLWPRAAAQPSPGSANPCPRILRSRSTRIAAPVWNASAQLRRRTASCLNQRGMALARALQLRHAPAHNLRRTTVLGRVGRPERTDSARPPGPSPCAVEPRWATVQVAVPLRLG